MTLHAAGHMQQHQPRRVCVGSSAAGPRVKPMKLEPAVRLPLLWLASRQRDVALVQLVVEKRDALYMAANHESGRKVRT